MLAEMPAGLLTEWQAYSELEPFGPLRDDQRAGRIAANVANFAPFRGKDSKTFLPSDFFESLVPAMKPMTGTTLSDQAKDLTHTMGGKVLTREQSRKLVQAEKDKRAREAAAKEATAKRMKEKAEKRAAKASEKAKRGA